MPVVLTITVETDPEDSLTYLDVCVAIDGGTELIEYARPTHLSTTVAAGGAAAGQAVLPVVSVGDVDVGRRILVDAIEYEVQSVDEALNEFTLTINLPAALVGGEAVATDDATLQSEVEANLTARGYTWT